MLSSLLIRLGCLRTDQLTTACVFFVLFVGFVFVFLCVLVVFGCLFCCFLFCTVTAQCTLIQFSSLLYAHRRYD